MSSLTLIPTLPPCTNDSTCFLQAGLKPFIQCHHSCIGSDKGKTFLDCAQVSQDGTDATETESSSKCATTTIVDTGEILEDQSKDVHEKNTIKRASLDASDCF